MPVVAAVAVGIFGAATAVTAAFTTIGAITVFGVSLATIATVGLAVSTVVAAVTMASAFKKPASQESGTMLQTKLDPHAPVPVIYGRTATAGYTVFKKTSGTKNAFLSAVAVLSIGPIAEIETAKFDDLALTFSGSPASSFATVTNTTPADAQSKTFKNGKLKVHWSVGPTSGTALPTRLGFTPPGMSSATKGNGLAHVATRFEFDQEAFPGGEPRKQIYTVKGRPLYDPREDSTYPGGDGLQRRDDPSTWAFSENPYLAALDWTLGYWVAGRRVYGIGAPWDQVDVQAFVEGANVADLNEWKVGGQVVSDDDKFAVLTSILQAGGGLPVAQAGRISVVVNAPKSSVMTITDADIIGEIETTGIASFRERINTIVPQYRAESQNWETIPGEEVTSTTYVEEDQGERRAHEVVFGMVQEAAQAHQLAAYELVNAREALTVKLKGRPRLLNVRVGEAVTLTHGDLITAQKMVVMSREIDPASLTVSLELRAETDAKHAFALGQSQEAPPSPEVNGLDPSVPDAPGVSAWTVAATVLTNALGVSLPAIVLTGLADDPNATATIVEIKRAGGDWTEYTVANRSAERIEITGLTDGDAYEVGLSHRTVRGFTSERRVIGPVTVGQTISGGVRPGGIDWTSNVITNVPTALDVDAFGRLNANAIGHAGETLATLLDTFDADLSAATDGTTGLIAQATVLRDQAASNAAQALSNAIAAAEASGWAQGNAVASQTSAGHAASNATVASLQAGYATANASLALDRATLSATYRDQAVTARDQATTQAGIATTQAGYATANAAIAQSNATLSATFAGYAQSNATVSTTQAGYATANATLAQTSAGLSATYRDQAAANATIAQQQAGFATANAALATSQATLSATYRNDARSLAARTLPSTFENGAEFFSHGITGTAATTAGEPTTYYAGTHTWTFPTPYDGRSILRQSVFGSGPIYAHIRPRGVLPATRGRTFRGRAEARNLSGYANTNFYAGMYGLTADFSTLIYLTADYIDEATASYPATSGYGVSSLGSDWTQIGIQQTIKATAPSDLAWIVFAPYTFNGGGAQGHVDWSLIEFDDVTESVRAEANATIATTQAGYASANAALASASSTLSATYRDQAAANATIAQQQAGFATANAALATSQAAISATYSTSAAVALAATGVAASAVFPETISGAWLTTGTTGAPAGMPDAPGTLGAIVGGVWTSDAVFGARALYKAVVPWAVGKIYEVQIEVEATSASDGSNVAYTYALPLNAAYTAEGIEAFHSQTLTVGGGRTVLTRRYGFGVTPVGGTAIADNSAFRFVRFGALFNYGSATDRETKLHRITVRDVTALAAAEAQAGYAQSNATISQTQAGYATANAAIAQANAALSAVFSGYAAANAALTDTLRSYAQANATIATTQAGYASANAAAAQSSSTLSATYRDQAVTARDTAGTYRDQAQANATISAQQAGYASANAALASASSTLAASYRDGAVQASRNFGFEHGLTGWTIPHGSGAVVSSVDGRPNVFSVASGVGTNIFGTIKVPFDPSRRYRVRGRYWTGAGSGSSQIYIGFAAYDADGNQLIHDPGSYAYVAALGPYQAAGAGWVEYVSGVIAPQSASPVVFGYPPGTAFIVPLALMNYNSAAIPTALDEIVIEDVTESERAAANAVIATTQAGYASANAAAALASSTLSATYRDYAQANAVVATTQAAYATANAAAASLSQSISASLATGHLNQNSAFGNWTFNGSTGCVGWWPYESGNGTISRVTGISGAPYALRATASSSASFGFYSTDPYAVLPPGGAWIVIEADVTLVSGDLRGAGVHLWAPSVMSWDALNFATDTSGGSAIGAGTVGATYRFRKIFDARASGLTVISPFGMTKWTGFSPTGAVTLDWHRLGIRLATPQEIATQTVLPGLTANVTTLQSAVTDLTTGYETARFQVSATTGGGAAILSLISDTYGSIAGLQADRIYWGANTYFDDATDTLRTTANGITTVLALGASFGSDGQLREWMGADSTAFASMSRANAYFYRAHATPYVGGSAIPGGQTAGGKTITGSAGNLAATTTVASVAAGSLIEMTAIFAPFYIDADSTMFGDLIFEESNNGGSSWTSMQAFPVAVSSNGLGYGLDQWGADGAEASMALIGSLSGNMTYRIRFNRTSGANLYGSDYRIDGTLKVSPPLA